MHGHHAVARVVTIDTPHHGTLFAALGHGDNTRQMRLACDFVRKLAASDEPVEFVCFASQHDNLIVPRDGQILACAEAVWFERIGHLAMTDNDQVLRKLIEVVDDSVLASAAFVSRRTRGVHCAACRPRQLRRSTARRCCRPLRRAERAD